MVNARVGYRCYVLAVLLYCLFGLAETSYGCPSASEYRCQGGVCETEGEAYTNAVGYADVALAFVLQDNPDAVAVVNKHLQQGSWWWTGGARRHPSNNYYVCSISNRYNLACEDLPEKWAEVPGGHSVQQISVCVDGCEYDMHNTASGRRNGRSRRG